MCLFSKVIIIITIMIIIVIIIITMIIIMPQNNKVKTELWIFFYWLKISKKTYILH